MSNTFLNLGVLQAENERFDKKFRGELGNLSVQWVEYLNFIENSEIEQSFIQNQKYRNFYDGFSQALFPVYSSSKSRYENRIRTTVTVGSVRSVLFGKEFDAKTKILTLRIYLPHNISTNYPNLSRFLIFKLMRCCMVERKNYM